MWWWVMLLMWRSGFRVCSDSQWRCQICPAGTASSSGGRGSAVVPTMRVLGGTGVPGEWGWPGVRRGWALAHSPPQWRDPRGQLNSPGSTWWREKGTFQRLLSRKDLVVGDLFQDSLFVWRLSQQMSTQQTAWTRIWTRKPTEPWQYCDWALSL